MDILSVDLNNIKLEGDPNEDDPETIIHVRLMVWCYKFKQQIDQQNINACSMPSIKIVPLVHVKISKKRKRTNFY